MFFIFGLNDRQKEISSGSFTCPHCGAIRNYKLMHAGRYFSLYFLPIFKVKDLGEYVACQTCKHIYQPEVLNQKFPSAEDRLVASVRTELESGLPLHMMVQKLVSQGMGQTTADQLVQRAVGADKITCTQCGFAYINGVQRCYNCGSQFTQ
jgi:hypothetical protein